MSSSEKWLDYSNGTVFGGNANSLFNRHYAMTYDGVSELAKKIFDPGWAGLFSTPEDWISSLRIYPFNITKRSSDGTAPTKYYLMCGTYTSEIPVYETSGTYYNLGECLITLKFNNFADYNGYTKIKVWLPYLGFVEVMPNDCMGKYLEFRLRVDLTSGQGIYYICVSDSSITPDNPPFVDGDENIRILSTHVVQLGYDIPLSSSNTADLMRNIILGGAKAATNIATNYALSGGTSSSSTTKTINTARNPETGRQITTGTKTTTHQYTGDESYSAGRVANDCFNSAIDSLGLMHVSTEGDRPNNMIAMINSSASIRVIIYRPNIQDVDDTYNALYGKPLGQTRQLITIGGYTEISALHLESSQFGRATAREKAMLAQALSQGVILPESHRPQYTISIDSLGDYTVTSDMVTIASTGYYNDSISGSVALDDDLYIITKIVLQDSTGEAIETIATPNAATASFSFTMPADNVTVVFYTEAAE